MILKQVMVDRDAKIYYRCKILFVLLREAGLVKV